MAHIKLDRFTYYDVSNTPRILRGVCVDRVFDLRLFYQLFWSEIQTLDSTFQIDFKDACLKSERVLKTAQAIAELCGIPSEWLDLDLLGVLVHSSTDENGEPQRGYIAQIHYKIEQDPKPSFKDDADLLTFDQYYIELLTTLATTEGGLENAKKVTSNTGISQLEVEGYLATKADRLRKQESDPDNKLDKLKRGKEKYKELKAAAEARKNKVTQ